MKINLDEAVLLAARRSNWSDHASLRILKNWLLENLQGSPPRADFAATGYQRRSAVAVEEISLTLRVRMMVATPGQRSMATGRRATKPVLKSRSKKRSWWPVSLGTSVFRDFRERGFGTASANFPHASIRSFGLP
jgi:hypothetical protein